MFNTHKVSNFPLLTKNFGVRAQDNSNKVCRYAVVMCDSELHNYLWY